MNPTANNIFRKPQLVFTWAFIIAGLYLFSLHSYLLFHMIVELFSIAIAFCVFMIAWNSRRLIENNYLLFIGIAYLFMGCIDLAHTLSYKGMDVLVSNDTNVPTQLWIAGRYIQSFSFVIAFLFLKRKLSADITFAFFFLITFFVIWSIFFVNLFPDCFVEGTGLTRFKIYSEYLISLVFILTIILLRHYNGAFDARVSYLIAWSMLFAIGSELFFTFYLNVYGFSNLMGHYFKIASFYCIYRAIIETCFERPYGILLRDLKISEDNLKKHEEELERTVEERTNELRITNKQIMALSNRLAEAEDVERQRISRELHDQVGQNLTALGINLNILRSKIPPDSVAALRGRIDDSLALIGETTDSIRHVMAELRPPVLSDYGLLAALRWYSQQFSVRTGIEMDVKGDEFNPRLSVPVEGALFRIAQESLNNVAKHARATKVEITLRKNDGKATLVIKDNGVGFDANRLSEIRKAGKWGLTNIAERVLSIGGGYDIESSPDKGTSIIVGVSI